jgi:hypothetical protein
VVSSAAAGQRLDAPLPGARSPRNANYDIDVRLNHTARTLTGREIIRWRNISPRETSELQFHLYWNAWRDVESTWLRERKLAGAFREPRADAWGRIDVSALRVRPPAGTAEGARGEPGSTGTDGQRAVALARTAPAGAGSTVRAGSAAAEGNTPPASTPAIDARRSGTPWAGVPTDLTARIRFIAPDDGNAQDRTVLTVPLPQPVRPGDTVEIEVEWSAKVPRPFARTGYIDNDYFIAQWFPKLGVLQEAGWNTHQFHAATEFFSDFGVYDVRMTVPQTFVLGASGRQTARTGNADGTSTYTFHGEDIHDFAWTASPNYVDLSRTFEHATLPPVEMRLLLQRERSGQAARYFDIVAHTLRLYGEWFGPYPYGHVTIVDPAFQSQSDGMEYPTLFTGRGRWLAPATVQVPESTTAHEAGHQWWYGMVASNEFEDAWLDEGINTYATARLIDEVFTTNNVEQRYFGGFVPWVIAGLPISRLDGDRLTGYRDNAEADTQSTPTWQYWPGTSTFITYNKTALWLHTLERHLGWPTMQRVLSTYFERWKFRHPTPMDFFAVVNEVSGQDLTWFFDQAHRSANTFDYRLQELSSEKLPSGMYRTVVVARRDGEATFPIEVVTTFDGGEQVTERWDGRERRVIYTYERAARATHARIDPRRVLLLDVNYTNNSRAINPKTDAASAKWSLTWLLWLQEQLITYGFFL